MGWAKLSVYIFVHVWQFPSWGGGSADTWVLDVSELPRLCAWTRSVDENIDATDLHMDNPFRPLLIVWSNMTVGDVQRRYPFPELFPSIMMGGNPVLANSHAMNRANVVYQAFIEGLRG